MADDVNINISSTFSGTGVNQAQKGMVDLNQSAQQIVAGLREAAAASGASETEFLTMAGAASQAALAIGNASQAEQILSVAMQSAAEAAAAAAAAQGEEAAAAAAAAAAAEKAAAATMAEQNAAIQLAQQYARTAVATKDYAQALLILNEALEANTGAGASQIAGLETQIATTEVAGTATGAFGAQIAMLANPVLIATAAISASVMAVKSLGDAIHFAGQLQEERTAFGGVLGDFQKGNAILDEADKRLHAYGFTTQQTTDAFSELAPIIRESTSSTRDQAEALARIAVLKPDAPVKALSTAIEGIQTGNIRALSKELGLTKDEQTQLKQSTDQGKDAFIALNEVLDKHGVTLAVARERMAGQAGAEREAAQAAEDLTKAEAAYAAGPGLVFTQAKTLAINAFTDSLSYSSKSVNGFTGAIGAEIAQLMFGTKATDDTTVAVQALGAAIPTTATAIQDGTQQINTGTAAMQVHAGEYAALMAVTEESVTVTLADAAAKDEVTAKTQLLTAETNAAVAAFMQLNPNIDAGGVAALVMAGKIDPLLAQLIQARLRAIEATNAMIAFNNQANIKAVNATISSNRAAGRMGRGDSSDAQEIADAARRTAAAADEARQKQTLAVGTKNQKVALLQQEYDAAVKEHGQESAAAINAQTALLQAEESGHKARAGAAATGATKLTSIEESTGNKIAKIISDRDAKLAALDKKYADAQLENQRKLGNDIANLAGNRRVNDETDDLDLVGKHTPDEARKLNDRERAEAAARQRSEANAEEARKKAEAGDAESADKTLQIREQANAKQEELDQAYYAKQAELGKNPELQAALKTQYNEATKAIQDQSDREVAQEDALALIKQQEREKEHDAIILSATDAANVVIGQAQRMADSVVKATKIGGEQAKGHIAEIGKAVTDLPTEKTITIHINQDGSADSVPKASGGGSSPSSAASGSGSSGGTHAAGGGSFATHGPTSLTVGDNPGGVEVVTVTPVSGKGNTTVGPGMMKMAGGGTAVVDSGGGYTSPVAVGTAAPSKGKASASQAASALKDQVDQQKAVVDLLESLIHLRGDLEAAANQQPFNIGLIKGLSERAALFLTIVESSLVPTTKKQSDAFSLYVDAAKGAIDILKDVADLRHQLQDNINDQPFDVGLIKGLANRAALFLQVVEAQLLPTSQLQVDTLGLFKDAVSDSVDILKDVADLRKTLSEETGPAPDLLVVQRLAMDANSVTRIVQGMLLPMTEDQAKAFGTYHDAAEASIDIIKSTSDLGKALVDNAAPPIASTDVQRMANEAAHVTQIVQGELIPITDDQAKALGSWSDAVGSSVSVIKDVSELTANLFTDYTSPTDAQIGLLTKDAKRVADGMFSAAALESTEGLTAGKAYADAVGATFSAFKDGLLFFDGLKSGDFRLDTGALASFETSTLSTLDVARRLGAVAATIPASNIAALGATTKALTDQSEALIKLAAVPFGDLPGAAAGLAGQTNALLSGIQGGGGGGVTVNVYNPPPDLDVNALVRQVTQAITQQTGMHR